MKIQKGMLFHNRYHLIDRIGSGASAEVWKAADTKAGNLIVALKIFSETNSIDTYGLQNFEYQFVTVFNMKHSNLLPPTGFDICEGCPYLVMQYCENGSCSSMATRVSEEDIIKFLHDVSAGLEYLHDNNIIHQDIKPENIMLDDNCNFLVTDFGISVTSSNSSDMKGGTQEYMGPERFKGQTLPASDIWALGASAIELITGQPPFGSHGGLLQDSEPLPELPAEYKPEVKDIILSCMQAEPEKRITAREIRQKIELYWETGSWTVHSRKKTLAFIAAAVASVLICAAVFAWDYTRTKTFYYNDYAEFWGIPKGIGKISRNEMSHRKTTYRFDYSRGKLRRVVLVNSAGKLVEHEDTEHLATRNSDTRYFYSDNGKIDYATVYNHSGRMLYKMDYDENMKTVTFRHNDEFGTEKNLLASTTALIDRQENIFDNSRISRYKLTYDDEGRLTQRLYAGLQNVPACDHDGIYGQRYTYDDKGRILEESFVGIDGDITSNSIGLAIKQFTYDEDDRWASVTYLGTERQGSHDGNYCSVVKLKYDQYGNRLEESYYSLDGQPSIRKDIGVYGQSYTYDKHGNRIKTTYIDDNGNPIISTNGIASAIDSFNTDGFIVLRRFVDQNDQPVYGTNELLPSSIIRITPNEVGDDTRIEHLDEYGKPLTLPSGYSITEIEYDSIGNVLAISSFGESGEPALNEGLVHKKTTEYNEKNQIVKESFFDIDGNPCLNGSGIASVSYEYNHQGVVIKESYYDTKGELASIESGYAFDTYEYDELGNTVSLHFFNEKGESCPSWSGAANLYYEYDPKTNFNTGIKFCDTKGNIIRYLHKEYDSKGNIIKEWATTSNGNLVPGTVVEVRTFDDRNLDIEWAAYDLNGNHVNMPSYTYSSVKFKYDDFRNVIEQSYWNTSGNPTSDSDKAHKRIREYDALGRIVLEKSIGIDGKPTSGSSANPEGHIEYDRFGNWLSLTCYDGYGNPCNSSDGWQKQEMVYNERNQMVSTTYFDSKGNMTISRNNEYAKVEIKYGDNNLKSEEIHYDEKNKILSIYKFKYNSRRNLVEQTICNSEGKQSDQIFGVFSRMAVDYEANDVTPKMRKFYNQTGKLIATSRYNLKTQSWGDILPAGSQPYVSSDDWYDEARELAASCPVELEDGVVLQEVRYTRTSLTLVLKLKEVSKYDMSEEQMSELRNVAPEFKKMMIQEAQMSIPRNVSFSIIITDKANRTIITM